jgi:hypothetical protein
MVALYFLVWLGLTAIPCVCIGMAVRAAVRKKGFALLQVPAWVLLAGITFFVGAGIQWTQLQGPAERAHQEMLTDAARAGVVGQPSSWLQARYGRPKQIYRDPKAPRLEHWWYTAGPWFIMEDDYVGFLVEDGRVKQAYLQVN